jgi:hypothetical protein
MANIVLITLGEHEFICPHPIFGFSEIKSAFRL